MANCILLCGAGAHLYQIVEEFEDRLIDVIQCYDNNIDRVEVINTMTKELPPSCLSWIGGSIIQRLESMKELWISKKRWLAEPDDDEEDDDSKDGSEKKIKKDKSSEHGIRYLKEKLPFLW